MADPTKHRDDPGEARASGDPEQALAQVPAVAALFLHDLLRGLEAEAGSARALLAREQRARHTDVERLRLLIAELTIQLDAAREERVRAEDELLNVRERAAREIHAAEQDRDRLVVRLAQLSAEFDQLTVPAGRTLRRR